MTIVDHGDGYPATMDADAVVWLDEPGARDRSRTGTKAANLAIAAARQMPIVDGFVVTIDEVARHPTEPFPVVRDRWERLSAHGSVTLVVRSSSPAEDLGSGSMAGLFASVVGVRGWPSFVVAYRRVVASADGGPMAVLVQRLVRPALGGVLFGVDPVSGRTDRLVIAAVAGGPDRLVSGEVQGRRVVVTATGRVVASDGDESPTLTRRERRQLVRLAGDTDAIFGGPQDVEWAIHGRRPILLQTRPITATAERGEGPLFGPGPVAETFPGPLSDLEIDLWLPPLREAIVATLTLTGSATRRRIRRSPVLTVADGHAVVDLELTGVVGPRRRLVRLFDPRPALRRLAASWRVGRLRGALPVLAHHALDAVDAALGDMPAVSSLDDEQLLDVLDSIGGHLRALHGHEMLVGSLLSPDGGSVMGAALTAVTRGRAQRWSDEDIIARSPVVLALVTPTLCRRLPLPDVIDLSEPAGGPVATRERLRLRARWMHELSRQVVRELGRRLVDRGALTTIDQVALLSRAELRSLVRGEPIEVRAPTQRPSSPIPTRFRFSAAGAVVTEEAAAGGAVGASGGRATGTVAHRDAGPGDVLVVGTL
ncbi:MAG: PEP/pyruvate-binding domain-containing protein, partial [Acidimicrobiales bacterium]